MCPPKRSWKFSGLKNNLMNKAKEFEKFLASVNLKAYREKYKPIKIVEMDLPKEIQAIGMLYKVYWTEKNL